MRVPTVSISRISKPGRKLSEGIPLPFGSLFESAAICEDIDESKPARSCIRRTRSRGRSTVPGWNSVQRSWPTCGSSKRAWSLRPEGAMVMGSNNPKTPTIARIWRGRTRPEQADEYETYNYEAGIKPLIEKALGVQTFREDRATETEFMTISYWGASRTWPASRAAIRPASII